MNEKSLAGLPSASEEIHRLTDVYNHQIANGKWRNMMSDNPRGQVDFGIPKISAADNVPVFQGQKNSNSVAAFHPAKTNFAGADFVEDNGRIVMEAEHASDFVPGKDANWQKIIGLGYNDEAVSIFPTAVAVRSEPGKILSESPCLQYKIWFRNSGNWKVTVRALPTFSVETGKSQRYAIAFDDAPPQIIPLPAGSSERDRQWQEDVLRNAALTTSTHTLSMSGLHTLKIWMVDPGIVIDALMAEGGSGQRPGYFWPDETRPHF